MAAAARRFIVELDSRYLVPAEWNPLRVLSVDERPAGHDGSTKPYRIYTCLCEEVEA